MSRLEALARAAGLSVRWKDAQGRENRVSPDVLRAVLAALCLPAASDRQIADSHAHLRHREGPPVLSVVRSGGMFRSEKQRARLIAEDGERIDMVVENGMAKAPRRIGYYRLDGESRAIAVTPPRAFTVTHRCWGIAAQLYALPGSPGFGDFGALARFAEQAAAVGAAAVAISPVHALFGADPDRISPYSPSSRLFLNPLYAPMEGKAASRGGFVDWRRAGATRLAALRKAFAKFCGDPTFDTFVLQGGPRLLAHARFELLDARFRALGLSSWRDWPRAYRRPEAPAVKALKPAEPEIAFQFYLQWRASDALAAAQTRGREAGMDIGLITDMAVGMDPAGSHAWSTPDEVMRGLSIGAPPDMYNSAGQNWGLTNFSPPALIASGYDGFLATLRASMRHAGGIRLDHAMGLSRLWVIPDGAGAGDGVYLNYPMKEMLALLLLESQRHRALVIAEDLGTVPPGFRERIGRAGLMGMRVLWFQRDAKGNFLPPGKWDAHGAALSTTHDLPTLAGWWRGRDIQWRTRLGIGTAATRAERKARRRDRKLLWKALRNAGCATGAAPPESAPGRFVDAALAGLALTRCPLALVPVEDLIGETEQPNIPGTIDQHPNWRRRLNTTRPLGAASAKRRARILGADRT